MVSRQRTQNTSTAWLSTLAVQVMQVAILDVCDVTSRQHSNFSTQIFQTFHPPRETSARETIAVLAVIGKQG